MTSQKLASEQVVVSAPMSFQGSAKRAWKLTRLGPPAAKFATVPLAILLISVWWVVICAWYAVFSVLLVPYRLIRRGSRKRKVEELRHRERLAAGRPLPPPPPSVYLRPNDT